MPDPYKSYIAKFSFPGQENNVQAFLSYFFKSTELHRVTTMTINRDDDQIEICLAPTQGRENLFERNATAEFIEKTGILSRLHLFNEFTVMDCFATSGTPDFAGSGVLKFPADSCDLQICLVESIESDQIINRITIHPLRSDVIVVAYSKTQSDELIEERFEEFREMGLSRQ